MSIRMAEGGERDPVVSRHARSSVHCIRDVVPGSSVPARRIRRSRERRDGFQGDFRPFGAEKRVTSVQEVTKLWNIIECRDGQYGGHQRITRAHRTSVYQCATTPSEVLGG
jgi:cell wall assembly regulator SMI1